MWMRIHPPSVSPIKGGKNADGVSESVQVDSEVKNHFRSGMILILLSTVISSSHVTIVQVGMVNSFNALFNLRSSLAKALNHGCIITTQWLIINK